MPELAPKWVRLASNGTHLGLLKIRFKYIFWFFKSPRFIPIGTNVPQFRSNSDIPTALDRRSAMLLWQLVVCFPSISRLNVATESNSHIMFYKHRRHALHVSSWMPGGKQTIPKSVKCVTF